MKWSGSKLGLLNLCGWAFAEDHVRHVRRPPHPALEGGGNAHRGLARIVDAVISDAPIDVRTIAQDVCAGTLSEYADTLEILTLLQEELLDDPPPFRGRAVMFHEKTLEMPIGPYTYEGTPDLVERYARECHLTDWKTHWRPISQGIFEADVQLPRYALLVDHEHPGEFDRFVLRQRFVRYRGAVREMTLERWQLEAYRWSLAEEIEDAELRVELEAFSATPGDWCTICSRTDTCPVVQALELGGAVMSIPDDEEAARVAGVARAIDAQSAKLKRQLKTYLGNDHPTGRVALAGGTYGFGPAHHKRASVDDVLEVYQAFERPLNPHVLRVDVDQLRRSLDRVPGNMRTAMNATIEHYDEADCRYRRGDDQEEEGGRHE